ncbi:MAG TPA: DinB family protein [Chitinophagaceae bacterium]|jgi:uncharacterized damage-inducible protein DinB|nr:DinB family protein [Chitinophagaceae bacterium]
MEQVKWFDRQFDFTQQQNIFPSIIERLEGTPLRLAHKLEHVPEAVLTARLGNTWTIKENAGHLSDLETLWQGRFEDICNGLPELRPTDLLNTATTTAQHNETPLPDLLQRFQTVRQQTLALIKDIDTATIFKYALHPRLKTPMRTMDHFLFVAEHDDHHLATISALLKALK